MVSLWHQSLTLQPTLSVPLLLVQESPPHRKPDSDPKLRGQGWRSHFNLYCFCFPQLQNRPVQGSLRHSGSLPWCPSAQPELLSGLGVPRAPGLSPTAPTGQPSWDKGFPPRRAEPALPEGTRRAWPRRSTFSLICCLRLVLGSHAGGWLQGRLGDRHKYGRGRNSMS